jgi:predicted ATPase
VTVDGVNLGLLSDGTLRVMTVLVGLVDPKIDVAMIEEPELALHPGLIGRLLAEIETASKTRQFVISTHSPQIVSWARPEAIRLVERNDGVTSVRALNEQQVGIISRYLHDEGSLGDYVFGGGVDE